MEGPRAWWGGGLAQHAGHTEAVLQQRQLKDPSQTGGGEGRGEEREERNTVGGGKEEKGEEQGSEHENRKEKRTECNPRKIVGHSQDRNGGVQKERKRQIDIDHKRAMQ